MDLSQLEDRLTRIELRLSTLEANIKSSVPPFSAPATKPKAPTSRPSQQQLAPSQEEKSGNWLGIVAIICFILAAGFIIKLSIDSGWLTPERQVGLAALLGLFLIGSGFTLLNTDRKYVSLLPGAGVAVLYLTCFAAHQYHSLIPFEAALFLSAMISALCIWLYLEIRHDIYPITAAVGAYLSPILLSFNATAEFSLYYFIICSVTFATISIWLQSRTLTVVSASLAILISGLIGMELHQDMLIAAMLAVHFLIFACGTYCYTMETDNVLTEIESQNFLPVLLIFYVLEYYFINRVIPGFAPWISLVFAAVLIGLYLSAKKWFPDKTLSSQSTLAAFTTIVCFHSVYLEILPLTIRPWLFVLIMVAAFMTPVHRYSEDRYSFLRIPFFALLAIVAIEYISIIYHLYNGDNVNSLIVSSAAFASMLLLVMTRKFIMHREYGTLLGATHILAVLALYRLTEGFGSLAVSASWLSYAIFIIVFAFNRDNKVMAKSALFVLGFAALKVLLYDVSSAPTIVRILCLLLTGVVLYGSGFIIRRISSLGNR